MSYQKLLWGFVSLGAISVWTNEAQAATLTNLYTLNNTLADRNGGPNLVSLGGTLAAGGGYTFGANEGLRLSNAFTPTNNGTQYSIVLDYRLDATSGSRKLIDFKNLISDSGLYSNNGNLTLVGINSSTVAVGSTAVGDGNNVRLVLTRDTATGTTNAYYNGIPQFTFNDFIPTLP